jgi:hypothetical protein
MIKGLGKEAALARCMHMWVSLSDTRERCALIGILPHAQEVKGFCMLHSVQVHTRIAPHFEVPLSQA